MRPLVLALALLPLFASAQNVRVGKQPSAVFSPTPGGYILRQPGPAHNISLTPQPVNPPSGGIKGVGAFSGGQRFRLNGNEFEMGGKYEMPLPKTAQNATVTAISKIPAASVAKSVLRMLPVIGVVVSAAQELQLLKDEWDNTQPSNHPTIADPGTGQVYRMEPEQICAASAADAWCPIGGTPLPSGWCTGAAFSIVDGGTGAPTTCYEAGPIVDGPTKKKTVPPEVIDSVADSMSPGDIGQILDEIQSSPNGADMPMDLPSDLPTTVTGPSSVPDKSSTTTNSDGSSRTTTTSTNITYNDNTINITNSTSITNRAPDGSVVDSSETVDSGETPPDPNPDETPPDEPTPGLCEEFPDILACKKLEAPDDEPIPESSENISLQTGPSFDGGSCIPDVTVSVFGTQVTALSMAVPCGWIVDYLKPLILLLASLSAVFIIYPRTD